MRLLDNLCGLMTCIKKECKIIDVKKTTRNNYTILLHTILNQARFLEIVQQVN